MLTGTHYRPEIDGVRAIAVALVVLHHLHPALLPGGFIGVDVFFVISGYLITGQIATAVRAGDFSFREFYKRRINRIVPPLVVVVAATLLAGYFILSPYDYMVLAKSAATTLLGFSNVFFWKEYGSYFSGNAAEAPLLHTWSLGVEEQFYLLWPLAVVLLLKLSRRAVLAALALGLAGGLALSQFGATTVVSASYYLLPTRFFELLTGAALAIVAWRGAEAGGIAIALRATGLSLILGSAWFLSKSSAFPGLNAAVPCLGAALLILAGPSKSLGSRLMTRAGLISYSLYLWHWPFISYLNYLDMQITPAIGIAVVAASIVLASLTWKYVEIPCRRGGNLLPFSRVFTLRFAVPAAAVGCFAIAGVVHAGFPGRFEPGVAQMESDVLTRPEDLRTGCHVPAARHATPPDPVGCRLGATKDRPEGMLLGDSFANHFSGMVDVLAAREGIALMDYTMGGCPPLIGYRWARNRAYAGACAERNQLALDYARAHGFKYLVLASAWPNNPEAARALGDTLDAALAAGMRVTVILGNPKIAGARGCAIRARMYGLTRGCTSPLSPKPAHVQEILRQRANVHVVDPAAVMCRDAVCHSLIAGKVGYRDDAHLNDAGSRELGRLLLSAQGRLFP